MDIKFFDAHCHLQLTQFDADREEVLARMQEREVGAIVVGTDFKTSREAIELAEQYDFLWASVGLHPNDNIEEEFDVSNYKELAADPKVIAIGECGLDYFHFDKDADIAEQEEHQRTRFVAQIDLAVEIGKPLIIHCRSSLGTEDAHDDLLAILAEQKEKHGEKIQPVMHFFTGSGELAQKYLDLGCCLSFPGPITYTDMYDDSIRIAPLDKILSETDSPFAAPVPHRGQRNEPAYVQEVVKKIASIKNLPVEEVKSQIILNSQRVFGI
jgi:TatD DNase family protein